MLDLSGGGPAGGEQGLLGLAFSPDGAHLYVDYTDTIRHTARRRVQLRRTGRPTGVAAPAPVRGAAVRGTTTAATSCSAPTATSTSAGDGGAPATRRQRAALATLLGKMLRIDVDARRQPVRDPAGQPVRRATTRGPEIWALGPAQPLALSLRPRRPATCTSATSDRTRGRRSTLQPAAHRRRTTAGPSWRARTVPPRPPTGIGCLCRSPNTGAPRGARSRAATSTGATPSTDLEVGAYVFADFCGGDS